MSGMRKDCDLLTNPKSAAVHFSMKAPCALKERVIGIIMPGGGEARTVGQNIEDMVALIKELNKDRGYYSKLDWLEHPECIPEGIGELIALVARWLWSEGKADSLLTFWRELCQLGHMTTQERDAFAEVVLSCEGIQIQMAKRQSEILTLLIAIDLDSPGEDCGEWKYYCSPGIRERANNHMKSCALAFDEGEVQRKGREISEASDSGEYGGHIDRVHAEVLVRNLAYVAIAQQANKYYNTAHPLQFLQTARFLNPIHWQLLEPMAKSIDYGAGAIEVQNRALYCKSVAVADAMRIVEEYLLPVDEITDMGLGNFPPTHTFELVLDTMVEWTQTNCSESPELTAALAQAAEAMSRYNKD